MASGGGDSKMSEETFDYICNCCAKENITKEAIKYCVECKEYYCDVCVQLHAKFPGLGEHSLLDVSTIQQTDQSPRLPSFPTERCSIHQGKVVDMYCGDHDSVGCYACIAINHKTCTDIHSVPDDIDQISIDGDYDKTCTNLQTFIESLQTTMNKSTDDYAKKIDDMKENALLAVTENRRELDATLDRLEEKSRRDIEAFYQELKSQLLAANEKLESILNECIQLELKLKQAKGNTSQSFVCAKIVESTINREQDSTKGVDNDLQIFDGDSVLSYTADYRLIEQLQNVESMGKVQGSSKEDPYVITRRQSIDIRVPSDTKTCCSYGSCIFGDNDILITDCNNSKLKRVNTAQMSVKDYIDLPYDITGVCKVNNEEVAVGCYDDKMIVFVSVGKTMTQSQQLKLNHKCFHVSHNDAKLYLTDDKDCLYIYNMVGTLLQTVSTDSKGEKLFVPYCLRCVIFPHGKHISTYVTNFWSKLICLDETGNHIKSIEDSSIEGADGVVLDGRGHILVAGRKSNNIVQLSKDGTKQGIIVKEEDGIKLPMSLCFRSDSCKLIVTMKDNDKMMVFDLI